MGRIIYIDRSRVETRQACPRQRFFSYDYLPIEVVKEGETESEGLAPAIGGIARSLGSLPLLNGIAIHAAHARLLAGWTIDRVIDEALGAYSAEVASKGVFGENDTAGLIREQIAMLEGMVRLWAKWRLPAILEEYELAYFDGQPAIELAWEWEMAPGLVQRLRMDAILRRRADRLLHILDYKSAKYVDDAWSAKFDHCLQTELYVQALKEKTGEQVGGMLYEGLIKGAWRKDTAVSSPFCGQRIQSTPYCYAYLLDDGGIGQVWSAAYTAKKGFKKVRIIDVMPTKDWVEKHLQYMVKPSEMFVVVPPITPPPFELERIKRQVVNQELWYHQQLDEYRRLLTNGSEAEAEDLLDIFAPQVGSQCVKYGLDYACSFLEGVCWTKGATPLEDGGFEKRTPHHDGEREAA